VQVPVRRRDRGHARLPPMTQANPEQRRGGIAGVAPGTGDTVVTSAIPAHREVFQAAVNEAVAPYKGEGFC